jgi:hypothetical protein
LGIRERRYYLPNINLETPMGRRFNYCAQFAAIAVVLSAPLPALALSCMAPDPIQTIEMLDQKGSPYTVVYGDLSFPGDFSTTVQTTPDEPLPLNQVKPASVSGIDVRTGELFEALVKMERVCSGPWCGGTNPGQDLLIIIEWPDEGTIPTLRPGACTDKVFADPTEEMLRSVSEFEDQKSRRQP